MKKIPTMFERDWGGDRSRVTNKPHPDCAWGRRLFIVLQVEEHRVQIQTSNRGPNQRKNWTSKRRFFSKGRTGYTFHGDGSSTAPTEEDNTPCNGTAPTPGDRE